MFWVSRFRAGPHPLVLMLPAPSLIVKANKREAGSGHYCDNAGHAGQALYFAISDEFSIWAPLPRVKGGMRWPGYLVPD